MPQTTPSSPPPSKLSKVHRLVAVATLLVAFPLALYAVSAIFDEALYTRDVGHAGLLAVLGALAVIIVVPAVIANQLLPKDPSKRKPGLVRDVFAGCWTAATLGLLSLSGGGSGSPMYGTAERLEQNGHDKAAWLGYWMAGPTSAAELTTNAKPEPATEPPKSERDAEGVAEAEAKPEAVASEAGGDADEEAPADEDTGTHADTDDKDAGADSAEADAKLTVAEAHDYSPAELFSAYAPAVLAINVNHGPFRSGGTGFFIDEAGTIATNHHVIANAEELSVKLYDGTKIEKVELLTSNAETDLALLRIDPSLMPKPPAAPALGDSESVEVGEPVSVIGNPLGLDHTLTNGIVSARRVLEGERYIQMSAPISPGNSGGPVFNRHAEVIGVSVGGMRGGENLNLAVPISQLRAMIADDYPERRGFGVSSW